MAVNPDWTTTLGKTKRLQGQGTINGSNLNGSGWANAQVRLEHLLSQEVITDDAELSSAGIFTYVITPDLLTYSGLYAVKFSATSSDGKEYAFPENEDAILFVDD